MRWSRVCVESIGYVLPEQRVTTAELEDRLAPLYAKWKLGRGQLHALTGIDERRWWAPDPSLSGLCVQAAHKALDQAGLTAEDIGAVVYGGVNRENLEPSTACPVADGLGIRGEARVFDISNACLGVLEGMTAIANMIELGQIRAGIAVAAESAREIADDSIARMLANPTVDTFRLCLASLTGGSAAVAVVLTDSRDSMTGRRLVGGAALSAPEHHRIARWGPRSGLLGQTGWVMETDAAAVLQHGVALGQRTWEQLRQTLGLPEQPFDKVICHQVGSGHRNTVLPSLGIAPERDFSTFPTLGNTGPVALPLTAARADEAGFLQAGDRVGFLGIGTGLNCLMLALEW